MHSIIPPNHGIKRQFFGYRLFGPVSRHGPGSCLGFQVKDPGDAAFARENKRRFCCINIAITVDRQVRKKYSPCKIKSSYSRKVTLGQVTMLGLGGFTRLDASVECWVP